MPDFLLVMTESTPVCAPAVRVVIDLKREKFEPSDIAQVKGYGEKVLLAQPTRKFVDVALCNCTHIQGFQVFRSVDGPFMYTETELLSLHDLGGQNLLLALLQNRANGDGFAPPPMLPDIVPLRCLASGACASVYAGRFRDEHEEKVVIKYYRSEDDGKNEEQVLQFLAKWLPEALRSAVPKFLHRYGPHVVVSPICDRFDGLVRSDMETIVAVLEGAHKLNILHRDVAPPNILRKRDLGILLNDWASALVATTPTHMAGTLHFASDFVLDILVNGKPPAYRKQDDLISLVRVVTLQARGCAPDLRQLTTEASIQAFWSNMTSAPYQQCLEVAEALNYTLLKKVLGDLLPLKKPRMS